MVADDETSAVVLVVDTGTEVPVWFLDGPGAPDLRTVQAIARMQLVAGRLGWQLRIRRPCERLCALLELTGLDDVIAVSGLEVGRQPEEAEELGVDEVVVPRDPPV